MSQYAGFSADITSDQSLGFNSIEEIDEAMALLGIDQHLRQLGKGTLRAQIAAKSYEEASLFADRFSTRLSIYLEPPEGMIGLLLPRTAGGQFLASGDVMTNQTLMMMPSGTSTDIVGEALVGSEALAIPLDRFQSLMNSLYPNLTWMDKRATLQGEDGNLLRLKNQLISLLVQPEPCRSHQLTDLLEALVLWIGDTMTQKKSVFSNCSRNRKAVAKKVQEYLEENYASHVSIEELCQQVGAGARTIQRSFRDYFSVTTGDYLNMLRMNACRHNLLVADRGESTVAGIALESGFSHLGRFSVGYKEQFGEGPRETLARRYQKNSILVQ